MWMPGWNIGTATSVADPMVIRSRVVDIARRSLWLRFPPPFALRGRHASPPIATTVRPTFLGCFPGTEHVGRMVGSKPGPDDLLCERTKINRSALSVLLGLVC